MPLEQNTGVEQPVATQQVPPPVKTGEPLKPTEAQKKCCENQECEQNDCTDGQNGDSQQTEQTQQQ